jgi:hypothetical protein
MAEQHRVGDRRPRLAQRVDRLRPPALHRRRISEELVIVDQVHRVIIRRRRQLQIGDVGGGALAIGLGGESS